MGGGWRGKGELKVIGGWLRDLSFEKKSCELFDLSFVISLSVCILFIMRFFDSKVNGKEWHEKKKCETKIILV